MSRPPKPRGEGIPMRCTCPKVDSIGPHDPMPDCKPALRAADILDRIKTKLDRVEKQCAALRAAAKSKAEERLIRASPTIEAQHTVAAGCLAGADKCVCDFCRAARAVFRERAAKEKK